MQQGGGVIYIYKIIYIYIYTLHIYTSIYLYDSLCMNGLAFMAEGQSLFGMTGNSLPGVQLQSTPDLHFDFP